MIGCVGAFAQTYRYDDAGQLLGAIYSTGQGVAYAYDNAGNLLSVAAGTSTTTGADLELTGLVATPTALTTSAFANCSFDLINHGPQGLSSAVCEVDFYLSVDPSYGDSDDVKIGSTLLTTSVAPGASTVVTLNSAQLANMVHFWPASLLPGSYYLMAHVTIIGGAITDPVTTDDATRDATRITYEPPGAPAVTEQPASQTVAAGSTLTLTTGGSGTPPRSFYWQWNGTNLAGANSPALNIANVQPANTGIYTAVLSSGAVTATSAPVIVGLTTTQEVLGGGAVIASNIVHPNGNVYDQVLLQGAAATITAGYTLSKVTRVSYIDMSDDIVQVEFAGPGTLSLVLDSASGPALPVDYNQAVVYMKGHAGIVISGANEYTNVSVFTVGRATAFDPTGAYNILLPPGPSNNPTRNGSPLFVGHAATIYNGVADLAFIAILSADGKFGGIHTADANYYAASGLTGVYAPGVQFVGPVYIGNITAFDTATPVIVLGAASDTRITGGNLSQDNNAAVQVSGVAQLKFVDGGDSSDNLLPAQDNQAVLEQNGMDVTTQVVVNPP